MPQSEVLKKIGLLWQGMSEDDKKPYNDQAEQAKVRARAFDNSQRAGCCVSRARARAV